MVYIGTANQIIEIESLFKKAFAISSNWKNLQKQKTMFSVNILSNSINIEDIIEVLSTTQD